MALQATIILLSAQGQSAAGIAQTLGLTTRTVYEWRRRWRQRGVRGLADSPRSGRPRQV
ncbi:helix-turn-helix domain-containing protein [Archangium violaceum]|uniref:helix-turn-helix domain-containing protein n=1 Tax=Archangium violaceum TaxID=83451 RepID=UPI0036DA0AF4